MLIKSFCMCYNEGRTISSDTGVGQRCGELVCYNLLNVLSVPVNIKQHEDCRASTTLTLSNMSMF